MGELGTPGSGGIPKRLLLVLAGSTVEHVLSLFVLLHLTPDLMDPS